MVLLVSLTSLTPVVKATTYVWDNLNYVEGYEGEYIHYPHPDRLSYDISPYNTKGVDGKRLHHCQVDSITSRTLVASADILCTAIGAYIGAKILGGGVFGAVAGGAIGGALALLITYMVEAYFFD
jgi:hypothetical protein